MRDECEREMVKKLRKENMSYTEIGKVMGLSRHVVRKLHKYQRKVHTKKPGPKSVLDNKDKLSIKRQILVLKSEHKKVYSNKLKIECGLDASARTIRRHLAGLGMRYRNVKRKIFLTRAHREKRVDFSKKWITSSHNWHETIFSDEKRFSLDGPDNWMSYIAKNEENSREKRQCKGGGVMVWLMVMPNGLLSHKIIEGKFGSKDYLSLLKTSIVPILKLNYGANFFFQEDNCSVHKAKVVQHFMSESKIKVLEWPAKSPDLNIVEDIWEQLSNDIYDGPQFKKKCQLIERINETIYHFNSMKRNQIMALYDTIRQRLITVLEEWKYMEIFNVVFLLHDCVKRFGQEYMIVICDNTICVRYFSIFVNNIYRVYHVIK